MATSFAPVAWHHLQLDLPGHWEVVAYRKDPRNGEIALADRAGEALRAFWRVMQNQIGRAHV